MQPRTRRRLALRLGGLALLCYAVPGVTCGFHDPTLFAQAMVNHTYPNALHVTWAIKQARQTGLLPPLDAARVTATGDKRRALDRAAFMQTMAALYAIGIAIDGLSEQGLEQPISVLILESMLWTRFSPDLPHVRQGMHAKGPEQGDVVLITEMPVVLAIQQGSLSIERAVELGVVRVYADDQRREALLARFGSIGTEPLDGPRFVYTFQRIF